jgi:hypothetical protein
MSKKLKAETTTKINWVGVRAAAREYGISPGHLSNVLHRRRKATPALLEYLHKLGIGCE